MNLFSTCKISVVFAYLMVVYVLASVYYFVRTRPIGTPFRTSISYKSKSSPTKERNFLSRCNRCDNCYGYI